MNIPDKTLEEMLNYLGGRPWAEVNELMVQLISAIKENKEIAELNDKIAHAGEDGDS